LSFQKRKDLNKKLPIKNTVFILLTAIIMLLSFNQITSAQGKGKSNRLIFSSHYTDFKTACFADEGQSGTDNCPAYKGYKLYVYWGGCTSGFSGKENKQ
jgi:hypothetical protein